MRMILGLLTTLLVLPAHARDEEKKTVPTAVSVESVVTTQVDGQIVIDSQGGLTEYKIKTEMPAQLRQGLDKAVRQWKFEPVIVNGKPVRAQTNMRVTLAAYKEGEDYRVKVDNVTFPGDAKGAVKADVEADVQGAVTISRKSMPPPGYPMQLLSVGGVVLLYLKLTPEGKVEDAVPVQTSLLDVKGKDRLLAKAIALFEKSAVQKAKTWRFDVVMNGGTVEPRDLTVSVPVEYLPYDSKRIKLGQWRTEVRGPRKEASWLASDAAAQKIGVSDVANGEIVPLATSFKLAEDVSGTVL